MGPPGVEASPTATNQSGEILGEQVKIAMFVDFDNLYSGLRRNQRRGSRALLAPAVAVVELADSRRRRRPR
jgi:hypothetical protein